MQNAKTNALFINNHKMISISILLFFNLIGFVFADFDHVK